MDDQLLTVSQICQLLQMKPSGIYSLLYHHRIPCIRLSSRCVRFRRSEIEAWIAGKSDAAIGRLAEQRTVREKSKRGRPRRTAASTSFVDSIVESAKREAGVV